MAPPRQAQKERSGVPWLGHLHPSRSPPTLVLPALTCLAGALFHALLLAAAVWAWVSLLRSSAARQRVSPWLRPPGDLDAATQDREAQITRAARRLGCALGSRPRSPRHPRRVSATRPGAPGSPPRAHARTRTPPAPSPPQASSRRAAAGTRRPNPQPQRRHTLSPHPLFFAVTRSPSVDSLARRGAFTVMHSPTLCGSPSPRLSVLAPSYFLHQQAPQPTTHPSGLHPSFQDSYSRTPTSSGHIVTPYHQYIMKMLTKSLTSLPCSE